jgi:hypothetical protein
MLVLRGIPLETRMDIGSPGTASENGVFTGSAISLNYGKPAHE